MRSTKMVVEKNRGRIERRRLTTSTRGVKEADWPGLAQFVRLERSVTVRGETTTSVQYAVTSLSPERAGPARLLAISRGRWLIESLFWIRDVPFRDVPFREDHSRIRSGTAPYTMSVLKNAAINTLRALKVDNITAALRENAVKVPALLHNLGIQTN